ncbi:MAG TPA: hypothetical protein VF746_30730 [Longimicrobium sp.]|jgi:hypothetical protein
MRNMHRWLASVVMAAVLGFGASQALAEPGAGREGPPECQPRGYDVSCRAMGATRGECHEGQCLCVFVTP